MQQSKPSRSKSKQSGAGSIRIIGGSMRGRKIAFSSAEGLRPTLDRIRETLFNWLANDIAGASCLDLFAGSGALGFEAISRGADSVVFVEVNSQACTSLKNNIKSLGISNNPVINGQADIFLAESNSKYDLVFLDPPFGKDFLPKTLSALIPHLNEDALVYVEQETTSTPPDYTDHWKILKSKKTSQFYYQLITLKKED